MRALAKFGSEYFESVEGWLSPDILAAVEVASNFQGENGIGKFFIPLHELLRAGEVSVAVDLFEAQRLNVDFSGAGSRERFMENLRKFATEPERAIVVSTDSMSWRGDEAVRAQPRIISIDGGHTIQHTVNDLRLAERVLAPGGIVIVDDYQNQHWPGVHQGVARHFFLGTPRLAPCFLAWNKLFLVDFSWYRDYLDLFERTYGRHQGFKGVDFFGYRVVVIQ